MHEANAILAINSLDRYITYTNTSIIGRKLNGDPIYQTNNNQPVNNGLEAEWNANGPFSSDFSITAPNALINGYIDKIIVSQIQLQYNLPTIVPGKNDIFAFGIYIVPGGTGGSIPFNIRLPYGFFTPFELAAMLENFINSALTSYSPQPSPPFGPIQVVYLQQDPAPPITNIGFSIITQDGRKIFLPSPAQLQLRGLSPNDVTNALKVYRLFGFNKNNVAFNTEQISYNSPNFLYTPFIDIFSDALTNYQALKDTISATNSRKGLVARLYLSGVGNPQETNDYPSVSGISLGSKPFVLTFDLNSPKVINWTPDTAVNSLDFQMRDCYGDLLFNTVPYQGNISQNEVYNSEFQMTLLCVEG